MSPKTRRWTLDELATLRRLARRARLSDIADALGRSIEAIRTKAAHERLPLDDDLPRSGPSRQPSPWQHDRSPE
jgi:hypothetical protein